MHISVRHDWTESQIATLYRQPFMDLVCQGQQVLRAYFPANQVQVNTLLNIKTGACPEDCAYCVQSRHYHTNLKKEALQEVEQVIETAQRAQQLGATRFCMGAAWRRPPAAALPKLVAMIQRIKALGMETCMTLGSLSLEQAQELKAAGLDYYNHNLDTSPEYYPQIITTRTYEERLQTLAYVREAGIKVCCGGILGLGESREDRIRLLQQLANLPEHPESVPLNRLTPIAGTPLAHAEPLDNFEFIRTVAVARILMPRAYVRLSAGRDTMSPEMQTLCFLAGANSIHFGSKLLTVNNCSVDADRWLMDQLDLTIEPVELTEQTVVDPSSIDPSLAQSPTDCEHHVR